MNKNVKIAKQLIKLAKSLIAKEKIMDERKFYFQGKNDNSVLTIKLHEETWKEIGKSPEWKEIVDSLNEQCKGNFYGIDHSCFKKLKDDFQIGKLSFDGTNNQQHKSPIIMIKQNLKQLNFVQDKF